MSNGQLTGSESQEPITAPAVEEQMVPQSKVNKLVGSVKQEGYQKGYEAALKEVQMQMGASQPQMQQDYTIPQQNYGPAQVQQSMGGIPQTQMTPEMVRQMIAQETEQMRYQEVGKQIERDFRSKIEAGKLKYPDFNDAVDPLMKDIETNPESMAKLVLMINSMDNTTDIMYDLAKNPHKVAELLTLSHIAPHSAQAQLGRLANSIKQNQEAISQQQATANEPLSTIKPSTIGTDSGSLTVKDFKRMPWLKG